jgi:hypothetical protein
MPRPQRRLLRRGRADLLAKVAALVERSAG